jgi:hypothetical protein
MIRKQEPLVPLAPGSPIAPLVSKQRVPGSQDGQGAQASPLDTVLKAIPNVAPNVEDGGFGVAGGSVEFAKQMHHTAEAATKAGGPDKQIAELTANGTRLRQLADNTADTGLKAEYLKDADKAANTLSRTQANLKTLEGVNDFGKNISDPGWIGKSLTDGGAVGPKIADSALGKKIAGLGTDVQSSGIGAKIQALGPQATRIGQNAGINTALAAGKVGQGLQDVAPNAGALGQTITSGGINGGNKAIDAGGAAGANIGKLGQKVTDATVAGGGKLVQLGNGQTATQAAEHLAPKLAQAGESAAKLAEGVAKRAGPIGTALNVGQGVLDVAGGKPWQRAAMETGGSLIGGAVGTLLAGAAGSVVPVAGTAAGAVVGNVIGSYVGGKAGDLVANLAGYKESN